MILEQKSGFLLIDNQEKIGNKASNLLVFNGGVI